MERTQAVILAAEQLHATEAAIDAAYAHVADFAARLVRLRGEARLSSTVGQDALDEITTALGHLGNAQSAVVRGHGKLNITKVRIGCGAVATGGEDKPQSGPCTGCNQARAARRQLACMLSSVVSQVSFIALVGVLVGCPEPLAIDG